METDDQADDLTSRINEMHRSEFREFNESQFN